MKLNAYVLRLSEYKVKLPQTRDSKMQIPSEAELAAIIEKELRSLDIGCGDVNIADAIAHYRSEDDIGEANILIDCFATWCAQTILKRIGASA